MGIFFSIFKSSDPLVLHDIDSKKNDTTTPKSDNLFQGLASLKHEVFRPSLLSFNWFEYGHCQTLMSALKETFFKNKVKYDKTEIFTFKDGGKIRLSFKGDLFGENVNSQKPLLFMVGPCLSNDQASIVKDMVRKSHQHFNIVVLNYRGISGVKLATPQIFNCYGYNDVLEPIQYIKNKYCHDGRAAYGCGWSMGADLIATMLGKDHHVLNGACLIQAGIKKEEMVERIADSLNGVYNNHLGKCMLAYLKKNKAVLQPYMDKQGIDLKNYPNLTPQDVDKLFVLPRNGGGTLMDYYRNNTASHNIPKIEVPTLFVNTLDDPVINQHTIDYEIFHQSQNVALATTGYGGHLAYHSSLFQDEHWCNKVAVKFLSSYVRK